MTVFLLFLCLLFAALLAIGQLFLKAAATDVAMRTAKASILYAAMSPRLILALGFYAALMALWIYILTKLPLNRAYPFSLLGSALVPPLAYLVFGEAIGGRYMIGMGLVLVGLFVMYIKT